MTVLRSLEEGVPATVEAIAEKMEVLQEGALWFPGGSKEMRVGHFWFPGGTREMRICGRGPLVPWGLGGSSMWEGPLCFPMRRLGYVCGRSTLVPWGARK